MTQFEFQDACTFLRNATKNIPLFKNVRKRLLFIIAARKYKEGKIFWVVFHEVFSIPNTISTLKKTRNDETNSKTDEVKKCISRIYIASLDFKIKQKHH